MGASAAGYLLSSWFEKNPSFDNVGSFFNLKAGEFRAVCGLSGTLAGVGLIAQEPYAGMARSYSWRVPVIAVTGGLMTHPQVNRALTHLPLGIGSWFKDNTVTGSNGVPRWGVAAVYTTLGYNVIAKPSLDKVEDWASRNVFHHMPQTID